MFRRRPNQGSPCPGRRASLARRIGIARCRHPRSLPNRPQRWKHRRCTVGVKTEGRRDRADQSVLDIENIPRCGPGATLRSPFAEDETAGAGRAHLLDFEAFEFARIGPSSVRNIRPSSMIVIRRREADLGGGSLRCRRGPPSYKLRNCGGREPLFPLVYAVLFNRGQARRPGKWNGRVGPRQPLA
jgi:hypothetical protein